MTHHLIRSFILFLLILLPTTASVSASDYLIKNLSVSDGLSQSSVTAILTDSRGFLWIGTKHGLNRYDYNSVKNYFVNENPEAVSSNYIYNIFEDKYGGIWIISEGDICRYDPETDEFKTYHYRNKSVEAITALEIDDGIIFPGHEGKIVKYMFEGDSLQLLPIPNAPYSRGRALIPWGTNSYLLTTQRSGQWILDTKKNTLEMLPFAKDLFVVDAKRDSHGRIWIAAYTGGIYCYTRDGKLLRHYTEKDGLTNDMVTKLLMRGDELYAGTERGLNVINLNTGEVQTDRFRNLSNHIGGIGSIYIGNRGNLYIGTIRSGLFMLQNSTMRTFNIAPLGSLEKMISCMIEGNDNDLYCSIDGNGVIIFDKATDSWTLPVKGTEQMKVISMANWDKDHILLSPYGEELLLFNVHTKEIKKAPSALKEMANRARELSIGLGINSIPGGEIVALTDSVYFINPADGSVSGLDPNLPDPKITGKQFFVFADNDYVYTAWYHHLFRINRKTRQREKILEIPQLSGSIKSASFDGKEIIYLCSKNNVYSYNIVTDEVDHLDLGAINNIGTIYADGSKLWIGSNNRLFMVEGDRIFSFGEGDGVDPNEFWSMAKYSDSTHIYLGGTNGIVRINKEDTYSHTHNSDPSLKINLAEVSMNGVSAWKDIHNGVLRVPADNSMLRIKVICDEQAALRSKMYRFYLEGLDDNRVIESLTPTARISNLPSGRHITVKASCSLPDGSWSEPMKVLELNVERVWWQTWWFTLLMILLIAGAVSLIIKLIRQRWRNASSLHRQYVLERDVQLLANINESLRAPLARMSRPVHEALMQIDSGEEVNHEELANTLEQVISSIDKMQTLVDSPFEMLHPESLRLDPVMLSARFNVWLLQQVNSFIRAQRILRHLDVVFEPECDPGTLTFNASRLEMIITCVLSQLLQGGMNRLKVVISESSSADKSLSITFVNLSERSSERLNEMDVKENLSLMYAGWLADVGGYKLQCRFVADGSLVDATLIMPVSKSIRTAEQNDDFDMDSEDESSLPMDDEGFSDNVDDSLPEVKEEQLLAKDPLTDAVMALAINDSNVHSLVVNGAEENFREIVTIRKKDSGAAFTVIESLHPDIILLDDSDDGLELCRHLKSDSTTEAIPVIVVTSGSLKKIKGCGGDAFLVKPFDLQVLLSMCQSLLDKNQIM